MNESHKAIMTNKQLGAVRCQDLNGKRKYHKLPIPEGWLAGWSSTEMKILESR
jgi:hypothetical protein